MAKNYTMKEAVEIINNGTDFESIADIGRRYPILLHMITKVAAKAGDDFVELMNHMPDHLTANKVNTSMKNMVKDEEIEVDEDVEEGESTTEEPATKKVKATEVEKEAKDSDDYESMSGKELWDLLGKAKKRNDCKEKMGGVKKADMVAYIQKYGLEETEEVVENDEEATENDTTENPYEGISAMDLFKECKKRGIKAAPKKPAKYYIELLMKSDEEVKEAPETEESDDWGEEIEEPKEEKAPKKQAKKATKEKEEDADEDDDWDI